MIFELALLWVGLKLLEGDDKATPPRGAPAVDPGAGRPNLAGLTRRAVTIEGPGDRDVAAIEWMLGTDDPEANVPILLLLQGPDDPTDPELLDALQTEIVLQPQSLRVIVARVPDQDGDRAWSDRRVALQDAARIVAERWFRPLVIGGYGLGGQMALEVSRVPDLANEIAAVIVVDIDTGWPPLQPSAPEVRTVVAGDVDGPVRVELDALEERGWPVGYLEDSSLQAWALLVLAAAELHR